MSQKQLRNSSIGNYKSGPSSNSRKVTFDENKTVKGSKAQENSPVVPKLGLQALYKTMPF